MQRFLLLLASTLALIFLISQGVFALEIPGGDRINAVSIGGAVNGSVGIEDARNIGLQILSLAKTLISGVALLYIVLVGVYMIAFSSSEENIKRQKTQLIYVLVAFLFLNVPGVVYEIFSSDERGSLDGGVTWSSIEGGTIFWNDTALGNFLEGLVGFLRVFIFAVAIIMFTWGAIQLILSRGKDDRPEAAKNRLIYGIFGLIFVGFVEGWSRWIAAADASIVQIVSDKAGILFGIALFFAAPVAVFFLCVGAYYYITSAGNEERAKKGRAIVINTIVATLILIASLSFLTEMIDFLS